MEKKVKMELRVLRLDHRPGRDKRVSSHAALVARAFGASGMIYTGVKDTSLEDSVNKVVKQWGGDFFIRHASSSWKRVISEHKQEGFTILHLTMYGMPFRDVVGKLIKESCPKILIIVGGSKVPSGVYDACDHNVSVTNQPHSEIAALAVLLEHLGPGIEKVEAGFDNASRKIIPAERGKNVVQRSIRA